MMSSWFPIALLFILFRQIHGFRQMANTWRLKDWVSAGDEKESIEFIQKAAAKVDPVNNQVQLDDGSACLRLPGYSHRATSGFDEIPGLGRM